MAEELELEDALDRFARLLLDVEVLVAEFGRPTGRLAAINVAQRAVSIVTLREFVQGDGSGLGWEERAERRAWMSREGIVTLSLHPGCGEQFAMLVQTSGPLAVADALLASECLARDVPIVTPSWRRFAAVDGLRYVRWKAP